MISPETAWKRIAAELSALPPSEVDLAAAGGLRLARALEATADLPPADVSAMDGFALAGDVPPGSALPLDGTSAAGHPYGGRLEPGRAVRIMTGAVVPGGADRILQVEWTTSRGEGVIVERPAVAGAHIRRRGEVVAAGEPLLEAGTLLTPTACSLLAAHGHVRLSVHRAPELAVLTTGDELVPADREPAPGGLRDSNGPLLLATARRFGWTAGSLGIAADDPADLRRRIEDGLHSDVLLICGGVSMGERDFVENVLAELGIRVLFEKVAVQPGKPLVAARHDGGWVFGLPGNPASVLVTFHLFVRPALECLGGRADAGFWSDAFQVELASALPAGKARDRFLPAALESEGGRLRARVGLPRGSHDLSTYALGDALVRIPRDAPARSVGDRAEVLSLAPGPVVEPRW